MAGLVHGASQPIDLAALMPKVAHRLLGEPNNHLSRGSRLRFGNKGAMEIDTAAGWFSATTVITCFGTAARPPSCAFQQPLPYGRSLSA